MPYTSKDYKTKKALKEAVADGKAVSVWSLGPWPVVDNGTVYIEGPQYPKPHRWYASCTIVDGLLTAVK
jgi:hypothetical protein